MENLKSVIGEHPFMQGLDEHTLDTLVGCASNVRYNAGDYLARMGQPAEHFFIIRHGHVSLEINAGPRGIIGVHTVEAGDVLGWSWLIEPYKWHFDARAVELTRVIALNGECLRKKCEQDHDIGYALMKRVAQLMEQRLTATRMQLLDMYGTHV